jgi:hypothetical protein
MRREKQLTAIGTAVHLCHVDPLLYSPPIFGVWLLHNFCGRGNVEVKQQDKLHPPFFSGLQLLISILQYLANPPHP